ncbi:MAG: Synechococcus phage [Actinomycetota bacterium]|jgi:hypothetical protein
MSNLNEKEFLEIYGEAKVVFTSYYKYSFSFRGEFNGKSIYVSVGGNADDIYRFDVDAGKEYAVKQLGISYAEVKEGETTIAEFTDRW